MRENHPAQSDGDLRVAAGAPNLETEGTCSSRVTAGVSWGFSFGSQMAGRNATAMASSPLGRCRFTKITRISERYSPLEIAGVELRVTLAEKSTSSLARAIAHPLSDLWQDPAKAISRTMSAKALDPRAHLFAIGVMRVNLPLPPSSRCEGCEGFFHPYV
jgi:hypothetical protein